MKNKSTQNDIVNHGIIAELVSAPSTHAVTKQPAWKTLKRFQGLFCFITARGFTQTTDTLSLRERMGVARVRGKEIQNCHPEFISGSTLFVTIPNKEEMLGPRIKTLRGVASGNAAVQHDNRRGFTLIELLVVVLIIGILAAVAIPQYQKAVTKARFAEAFVIMSAIAEAHQVYKLSTSTEQPEMEDLDIEVPRETDYFFYNAGDINDLSWSSAGYKKEEVCICYNRETNEFVLYQNKEEADCAEKPASFDYAQMLHIREVEDNTCACC